MTQLALELPENVFSALRLPPAEFAREMRIAAAVQWYAERRISQEKAAEIATGTQDRSTQSTLNWAQHYAQPDIPVPVSILNWDIGAQGLYRKKELAGEND